MTTIPRRRIRAVATGFAAAIALVLATAAPAGAAPTLTPGGPYANLATVSISGTAPTGATDYALAQCDITGATTPAQLGQACHISTAISPTSLTGGAYSVTGFVLKKTWAPDWDLSSGAPSPIPGSSTACSTTTTTAATCAIVVSFYGTGGFITAEASSALIFTP